MRPATAIAAALLLGCAAPTESDPGPLGGRWLTTTEALRPAGTLQRSLTFGPGRRFTAEVRTYGVYPGQVVGDLSAYSRIVGAYQAEGDRLTFAPDTLVEWDRFYGAASAPTVRSPYPYGGFLDSTRYTVASGVLTLRYLSYPADAPVPTSQQYRRAD